MNEDDIQALAARLNDPDPEAQFEAAQRLIQASTTARGTALQQQLAEALASCSQGVVSRVLDGFDDPDTRVRMGANTLSLVDNPHVEEWLLDSLTGPSEERRAYAALRFGLRGNTIAIDALGEMLQSQEYHQKRAHVLNALSSIRHPDALAVLVNHLKRSPSPGAAQAVQVLAGRLGDEETERWAKEQADDLSGRYPPR